MVCQYEDICKGYGCKAKVFAKEKGAMKKKIGAPDLLILFTSTVSHKMVNCAVEEAKKKSIPVCRCHTSSASSVNHTHCTKRQNSRWKEVEEWEIRKRKLARRVLQKVFRPSLTRLSGRIKKHLQNPEVFNKIRDRFSD